MIVISADVQKAVRDEVAELGVHHFINKPLNEEKLNQLICLINKEVSNA